MKIIIDNLINMKNNLCFCSFVFGDYIKYIPYYIHSINEAYPDEYIKIFVQDEENTNVTALTTTMKNHTIMWDYKIDINFYNNYEKRSNFKFLRWLLPYDEFKEYKYVYFSDIDMYILKETPSLKDMHIKHMETIGLPYSNAIRINKKTQDTRLTGLHFVETKPYFDKVNDLILKYKTNEVLLNNVLKSLSDDIWIKENRKISDEYFLYHIVKETIGFGDKSFIQGSKNFYRPHHGIHLGFLRNPNVGNIKERRKRIDGFNSISNIEHIKEKFRL